MVETSTTGCFQPNIKSGRSVRKRILCVEDQIDTCELVAAVLRGYEVKVAHTVEEAREYYNGEKFSLILLDFRLPDGDGLNFCEEIRGRDFLTPIIFISNDSDLTEIQVRIAGGQKLIKKLDPNFIDQLRSLADNLSVRQ
jgi:DNA-binding response OmpR family regulator